ncbi:hypothetical protein [Microbacterium sp. K24]|uniref:hypothetical protein n=1 Tax=Microbacterium sp. K24 TaxID=2305446 RepID=UPI00109CA271|nr:hypothetical protein [Microbacterium sp. K24]
MHSADAQCRYCQLDKFETTIVESKAGFAVPSFGALVEGWSIVFPRQHVLALADLRTDDWLAFDLLLASVRARVESRYGRAVLFEHGSAGTGRPAACGVDHAHMHVVPVRMSLRTAITDQLASPEAPWSPVNDRVEPIAEMDYIYVEDESGRWVIHDRWLPSQVARKAIASHLGLTIWDWKESGNEEIVEATRRALKSAA